MSKLYNILQLDKKTSIYNKLPPAPREGWIKTIRTTLGMTYQQLAKRLQISPRRLVAIETAEVNQKLKLETLAKIADSLGCELQYVLVPKRGVPFIKQLEERAMDKACQMVSASGQHMSLENQLASADMEEQVKLLAQELLHKNLKDLWDE